MNGNIKRPGKPGWIAAWAVQIAVMLGAGALSALSLGVHPALYGAALWLLMPLLGAYTALRAVRRGLLNYAAWIAPPVCECAAHVLIWGYLPPAGAMLLCAFVSLIGAAAGEVLNRQKKR
ncbi:MAG: hypothetical protein IKE76_14940 [Clostridia bacterium]|nr:hypothetical protein [Clostridia bacterium]